MFVEFQSLIGRLKTNITEENIKQINKVSIPYR